MIEINHDEAPSVTLTRLMRQLADEKRGRLATEQALEDEKAAGQNAYVMAAAAHAYCAGFRDVEGVRHRELQALRDAMLAAHDATTPSERQTHVVVSVEELVRLREIEKAYVDAFGEYSPEAHAVIRSSVGEPPPEPSVGAEFHHHGVVFWTRRPDGWYCARPVDACAHCPADWYEVWSIGGVQDPGVTMVVPGDGAP